MECIPYFILISDQIMDNIRSVYVDNNLEDVIIWSGSSYGSYYALSGYMC